eukprot:CAMPEP_0201567930 /NCGR_PEP_ID=MMETSP0190_2-20130828/8700_1 /ASSEMBLY_ACC=CAM_ASM_000263 /TAXON_ID=37353 /ORGANISM="Rosalina sp." /LENGTH=198 /DNA_ID=CAMNT_0047988495 /DNA_START=123 /DNA_END=715 /DNA_ORIENTATION=+
MLKTIIFLTIIVKLAFGEEVIDEDIDDELTMTMDMFEALTTCQIDETDELNEIETEMQKRCLQINKKKPCLEAGTPNYPDGIKLKKKEEPNKGNDAEGECVYIAKKSNIFAKRLGGQCVAPAAVKKMIRRLRRKGNYPPAEEAIMAKAGLLSANEGSYDINYMIVTVVIIGLLIGFGAYYKYKGNDKKSSITSPERVS